MMRRCAEPSGSPWRTNGRRPQARLGLVGVGRRRASGIPPVLGVRPASGYPAGARANNASGSAAAFRGEAASGAPSAEASWALAVRRDCRRPSPARGRGALRPCLGERGHVASRAASIGPPSSQPAFYGIRLRVRRRQFGGPGAMRTSTPILGLSSPARTHARSSPIRKPRHAIAGKGGRDLRE
jgi:hypothetical protein